MEYRQHQLANGLNVIAECNPNAYMSAFGYFVRTGARDETCEIGGVSHFLEHMVFKGTPNLSAEEVNLKLDEMGSSSNARTGEESTIYHAAVLPEFQSPMVELLSDLMRPSLRLEDFETEKQVIIEEIMMYQDQPPYGGHEKIMAEYFGDHPLGQSVLGTVESVTALTPEKMLEYFQLQYSPSNLALVAAGDIDFDQLVRDAETFCGHWENFSTQRNITLATPQKGFNSLIKENSHQQYLIQMAPGPSNHSPDRFASRVLSAILGDDSGSRLYWEFLDSGLAESAGMGAYEYQDNGLILTYICCAPEQATKNLELLKELFAKVTEEGVTQHELDLAKSKISSHIVLASERTESRMFNVGGQWLAGQKFRPVSEIAAEYDEISLQQVNEVLEKYPLSNCYTLAVGPCSDW